MTRPPPQPDLLLGSLDALADATRLRLLRLLERQELGVVELCDILQLPQSTVSRHLKILADQHWLHSRRVATANLYLMAPAELRPGARRLWTLAREQTEDWPALAQDRLRLSRHLAQRSQAAQSFFAGAAGQWDKLRADLYGDAFTTAALLSLIPPDYVVADLGAGTGDLSTRLAAHVKHVHAVDNSAPMLKAAQKRAADLANISWHRDELTALSIKSSSCDAAFMVLVLSYLPDPPAALAELSRILKPTGRLILVDLLPHDRDDFRRQMQQVSMGFSESDLRALLLSTHAKLLSFTPLPPQPNTKGPALFLASATKAT